MQTQSPPHTWIDQQGRKWQPRLTISLAEHLKADGLDLFDPHQLSQVYQHPIEFLRLAAFLHRPESKEAGVDDLAMLDLMTASETIALEAKAAVEAALMDFFRRVPGGNPLAAVLARAIEAATQTEQSQVAMISGVRGDKAIAAVVDRALAPLHGALDKLAESGTPSGPTPAS